MEVLRSGRAGRILAAGDSFRRVAVVGSLAEDTLRGESALLIFQFSYCATASMLAPQIACHSEDLLVYLR